MMKVLIGILSTGENEFPDCIDSILMQTGLLIDYFVIENKPNFVNNLTSKIAISFDMEQSKTQVKDDRAIVQLNTNTGQIRVQALNGWTGILKVPTYMATNEAIVEIENVITVNPDPTPQVLVRPT